MNPEPFTCTYCEEKKTGKRIRTAFGLACESCWKFIKRSEGKP